MKTIEQVANEVLAGKWGSGDARKKKLIAAGYDYDKVQKEISNLLATNGSREAVISNMEAWATKIANQKYHYVIWRSDVTKTHTCPVCNGRKYDNSYGWNCIGFVFAIWHHGGRLASKCNSGVISDSVGEKIYRAKTDAEALKIARSRIGINDITVIRNNGKAIPKSKAQPGDICLLFDGDEYKHMYFIMSNNKIADSTRSGSVANNIRADRNFTGRYVSGLKVIIRYTGNGTAKKQSAKKDVTTIANEVIAGKWGSGDERKKKLIAAGYDYDAVQKKVNEILSPKPTPTPVPTPAPTPVPTKKAYDKTFPSLTLKKTNAEVIRDAVLWGNWIAGDNSFHYGRGHHAHHNGCYFCETQPKVKKEAGIKDYQKTYCCNPFIGAAWAHGGGVSKALEMCKKGRSWGFSKGTGYDTSSLFKNLGKPAKSKLKKGDVLCTNTHVMMYIGNGKIMEAGHEDDNVRNSKKWNSSIRITSLTTARYAKVKRVYRFTGSVNAERAIEFGEVSTRVAHLQAYLNWYFGQKVCGTPDGIFGSNTLKYVKKFQEKQKLKADGIVGPITIAEMKKVKK